MLHIASIPDDPSLQAVMYGPLVLAGQLGNDHLSRDLVYGPLAPDGTPAPLPPITATSKDPTGWVEPVPEERLTFRTRGQCEPVSLVPFYKVADQRYIVYWKVRTA